MQKYIAILLVLLSANLFAQTYIDIDLDNDGLIEVNDLETLNAMRYQLDGSGLQLDENAVEITTGCAPGGCKGYELTRDLDFSSADSYQNIANLKRWTDGAGWQPIGDTAHPFTAIFKTNNGSTPNVIYNLMIDRPDESGVGLFGHIGSSAKISGIGLLNAELSGHSQVGGLVGKSVGGDISNSYVSGRVVGKGVEVGSLAGSSSGSITNSYANGEVSGQGNGVGGLVGVNSGSITNSYAMGSVVGAANHVGGLVGDNSQGTISNCYTTGSVSGSEDIGGLVGISNLGKLIGNYVSGKTSGKRYIGGLVGINVGGTITRSYWDKTTNKLTQNTGGVGLSASELQSQNAQDDDSNKPYYKWSTTNWDFGTAEQYPILKYATGSDPQNPACGPGQTLPNCGALLLGQHASLERIIFSERVDLSPTFKPTELNYQLNISPRITQLQLTPTASNPASTISISRNGVAVGTTSSVITLDKDTSIAIAVSAPNQRPARYQFAVNYRHAITILGIPNEVINEGELVILNASHSLDTLEDQVSYRWTQTTGKAILSETANESSSLLLFIPADYVPTTEDYAELRLSIEVTDGKTTFNKNISLMVAKKDNGNIVVGSPSLSDRELTAPEIDLSEDSDGAGNSFSYQWQYRPQSENAEWANLDDATDKTYTIPTSAEWFTEYRVLIGYTDGQGYETIATSEATQYPSEEAIQDFIQSATPQRQSLQNANPPRTTSSQNASCSSMDDMDRDGIPSSMDIDDDNDGLIEICYLEDLDAIRYQLDGTGYTTSTGAMKITAGCPNTGCKGYELARDLDFNDNGSYRNVSANKSKWTTGEGWQPLGNGNRVNYRNPNNDPFKATFEGNGHTLSNLMINRPSTNYVGMFSYIESTSTKITNVGLLNVNVEGRSLVGGLVGENSGTITNSYATGSVEGQYNVGGLVGRNLVVGNSATITITNSYATGSVEGQHNVGGLVGENWNGGNSATITITNSYATGDVEGTYDVGGLVGENWNDGSSATITITNSYATGDVEGTYDVGGLVGENWNGGNSATITITNSYATGDVEGNNHVGGLVGENSGTITNSYATGDIEGTYSVGGLVGLDWGFITNSYATGDVEGNNHVGGLVGENSGTITNSYATGDIEGTYSVGGLVGLDWGFITNSYATGDVEGNNHVGGLVGENSGTITNSYATGDIEGTYSVGGLVGRDWGFITNSYATGDVEGNNHVGGLVGENSGTITNSYATGDIEGTYSVGGLVGRDWGFITNSYWDINSSGMTTSAGGTSKTMVELQSTEAQSTDANKPYYQWDDENWDFGSRTQYPTLKYAEGPNENNPACGSVNQPECGSLLLGQYPSPLDQLTISDGMLSPPFDEEVFSYTVMVNHNVTEITLNTTATNASISISSNTTGTTTRMGAASAKIPLKIAGNTVITVEVTKSNQRPTSYVITVSYYDLGTPTSSDITIQANKGGRESDIDENNSVDVNEGDSLELKLDPGSCSTKCEWDIPSALGSLLPAGARLNEETVTFTNIPVDYISPSEDSQQFTITVALRRSGGIARRQIMLTINKVDNGRIGNPGEATINGSSLIAPDLPDLSTDPDGVNDNSNISYQWQQPMNRNLNLDLDRSWMNIAGATTPTYTPSNPEDGEIYRVRTSYTDKQGYSYTFTSKAVRDIDIDDDGLIEIRYLEDLDVIRNNLSGTSYKIDSIELSKGCPDSGCNGYELTKDLDFNDNGSYRNVSTNKNKWTTREGWEPIRDNFNSFSGIFQGNNHTISNLMINRPSSSYIGLFFMTGEDAMIDGVNLDKIKITGRNHVGTLVGKNLGSITNSNISGDDNTTSTRVKGEDHVGGLVGVNDRNAFVSNVDVYGLHVEGEDYIGGIAGENKGTIRSSRVSGTGNTMFTRVKGEDRVGGLVGVNGGNALVDNVDVYRLHVESEDYIGGLAGENKGTIRSSRVSGTGNTTLTQVIGRGDRIGGLVGSNERGKIFISHAIADVNGVIGHHVGGLVGYNTGRITNSYAAGSVIGNANVGGLIGSHEPGRVKNSYARAIVTGNSNKGGLVGSKLSNLNITNSYWDINVSGITEDGSNQGKTTEELQTTSTGIYRDWNPNVWDFGTSEQYPALKHYDRAQCKQTNPPDYCGVLYAGQHSGLQSLQLSGNVILQDNFSNRQYDYNLIIGNGETAINLMPIASYPDAEIKLYQSDGSETTLINGVLNSDILLAASVSAMTIVVKDARSEVTYRFELERFEPSIDYTRLDYLMGYREGTTASLTAKITDQRRLMIDIDEVSFEWDSDLSPTMASGRFVDFVIPVDHIKDARTTATATVTLTATYKEQITSSISEGLLIIKFNNGTAQPQSTTLMVNGRILTAPGLISGTDVDGDPISMEYQWQEQRLGKDWVIVDDSESSTYEIPDATPAYTKYRVMISYKDGQSYSHDNLITTEVYTYIELDADDNGLIDIYSAAQLDAIRHQPDGTAYKASNDGVSTTMGCPDGGCNGYELKGHITLTGIWQPIDNFNTRFEGHGYTISNLNTTTTTIENAGMFSRTGLQAKIQNVGLINVAIKSGVNAGGLVGISNGIIANSYVVGNIIGGSNIDRSNAGGLVGINNGTISTSHAIVKVGNASSEYVGGLAGINNGTINNSYVIAKQLTGTSASKIGGIIGKTDNQDTSIVTNSYATVETIIKGGNRAGACSLSGDGDGIDDTSRMLGGNCIPSTLFGTGTTQ